MKEKRETTDYQVQPRTIISNKHVSLRLCSKGTFFSLICMQKAFLNTRWVKKF